jgi:glycosyltransferase involved in cell wall biosynthesis
MDFKDWAVLAHKDDSGFGRQAADLKAILGLGYHLVVPSEKLEDHPLDQQADRWLPVETSDNDVLAALRDIEGLIFFERHSWHPRIVSLAKQAGVKLICVPNWEWFRGTDNLWKEIDLFVCHSRFTLSWMHHYGFRNAIALPLALDINRFQERKITGQAKTFVHNAGIVDIQDRKATKDTIKAFMKLKREDIQLIVRMQNKVDLPPYDQRVKIEVGNLANPADLYKTGEVAIQPSKMEGNGFMVLEPFACGMPVITLDYPPMNEYILQKEMLVKKQWFKRRAYPTTWVKHSHLRLPNLNDLAEKINWCANNDLSGISASNLSRAKKLFDRDNQRKLWQEIVSSLLENKLDTFLKDRGNVLGLN